MYKGVYVACSPKSMLLISGNVLYLPSETSAPRICTRMSVLHGLVEFDALRTVLGSLKIYVGVIDFGLLL